MKTILVTGGIGSGKSEVCRHLVSRGIPVYDSDARTKRLYDEVQGLAARVDAALGGGMLGNSLLEREPHMKQKRRAEQWQRANAVKAQWRKRREATRLYRAVAEKEVGVAKFPERPRRVELYVVSNGL